MVRAFGLVLLLALFAGSAGAQSLRPFSNAGKWGYIDSTGTVLIPARFHNAYDTWSEGFARVQLDSVKYAYIDARGRIIGVPGFDGAMNFSGGHAAVRVGEKWGVIDTTGALVIPLGLKEAVFFYEGRAVIRDGTRYGYIDTRGRPVSATRFAGAHPFLGARAAVAVDKKWGVIDTAGRFVVEPSYDLVKAMSPGVYAAKRGDSWRLIDGSGRMYGSPFEMGSFFKEGLAAVRQGRKHGYIDTSGTWIIPATFDAALDFSGGRAAVRRSEWNEPGKQWGYIDRAGNVVIRVTHHEPFSEGLAAVTLTDPMRYGYIDTTGKVVIPPQFRDAAQFSGGMARVEFPDRAWGYIDRSGRTLWRGEPEPERPLFAIAPIRTDDTSGLNGSGPLVERAARLADRLDRAEEGGKLEMQMFEASPLAAIAVGAAIRVQGYVDSHPDDARLLVIAARLGRQRQIVAPISYQADRPPSGDSMTAAFAHNLRYLARAIELQPSNAEAHYWMGRLYAYRVSWEDSSSASLDSALYFGRRAMELAPGDERYPDAVTRYLLYAGRFDEAVATARTIAGGKHPVVVLFDDWNRVPIPPNAVVSEAQANAIAGMQAEAGIMYAGLRVRSYVVNQPAAQVEAFYRTRWPGLRFFEQKDVDMGDRDRMLVQVLRFKGQGLEPAQNEDGVRHMDGPRAPEGFALALMELTNPEPEMRARLGGPPSGTFSVLTLINTRRFK